MRTTERSRAGIRAAGHGAARVGTVLVVVGALVIGTAVWAWVRGAVSSLPVWPHCTATANGSSTQLDPEQAGNAAIIAAISLQRGMPARAASIAIATAMQESKLRDLDYGDLDSVGLFQQRPSQGWGTREQILDPVYATNKFYDALVKVDGYQNMPITEVAQRVQHSAYPSAYAAREPSARIYASALTGYSTAALSCALDGAHSVRQPVGRSGLTARAQAVAAAATREIGQQASTSGSTDGATIRFTVTGTDAGRLSWGLAQWAVARASGLDIVSVQIAGRQWRRDHPDQTWTTLSTGLASGVVLVRVSNG